MIVHFFKERIKPRINFEELIDVYFGSIKECTITSDDNEVVLEMNLKEFDFKYTFKITKRTAILSMYRLNSAYININLLCDIPCMLPQYISRLIFKRIAEICQKFELFVYYDELEDIHKFDMFELISSLSKEQKAYIETHKDLEYMQMPMNILNDMCHYQSMTPFLPQMVKDDLLANKYIVMKDKSNGEVALGVSWKIGLPSIFPPYINYVLVEEEENVVALVPQETFYKYTLKLMYEIKDDAIDFKLLYLNQKGALKAQKLFKKMRKSVVSLTNFETIKITNLIEK